MTEILFSFQCCDVGYEPDELPDCSTPHYCVVPRPQRGMRYCTLCIFKMQG